jgi:hypothetical protein
MLLAISTNFLPTILQTDNNDTTFLSAMVNTVSENPTLPLRIPLPFSVGLAISDIRFIKAIIPPADPPELISPILLIKDFTRSFEITA